jgi:hypothetical protein
LTEEEHEGRTYTDALFDGAVAPFANVASKIAPALGGHGRGHVTLRVLARSLKISDASLVRSISGPLGGWRADDLTRSSARV